MAGKINKIPEFYTIFARKMPDYIIRQQDRGQTEVKCLRPRPKLRGRGQIFKAEAKILAPRLLWPRGLNITGHIQYKLCIHWCLTSTTALHHPTCWRSVGEVLPTISVLRLIMKTSQSRWCAFSSQTD